MYDGTRLGCIGRCRTCGKAIQLRRVVVHPPGVRRYEEDRWEHFDAALSDDHRPELSPGVGAYYDDLIVAREQR